MKFRMYRLGEKGSIGVVEALTHSGASGAAAEKWGGFTEDYRAESVRERVDAKCEKCGFTFKMAKDEVERGYRKRCTLCRKEDDLQHKARIFLKVKDEFEAMLVKRAKATGKSVDSIRKFYKGD